ncbi:MAG: recombinase zinc beta ribbon domain-containing protein [Candidatus Hydrothermarchaeales archaeon]
MTKCSFCDGNAESTHFEFSTCKKHSLEFVVFKEKKSDMAVEIDEDMRVVERMVKLNPGLAKCPCCGGSLDVHHWKVVEKGKKEPLFRCSKCEFLG